MDAQDQIFLAQQFVGDHSYNPGDKFDEEALIKRGLLTERVVGMLRRQRIVAPLTPDTYKIAIARQPAGSIGRGFTAAYLEAKGIIEAAPEAPPAPAPTTTKKRATAAPVVLGDTVEITADAIPVGKYFIVPLKQGNFKRLYVADTQGRLLRPQCFVTRPQAEGYIAKLDAAESTASTTSDTSGAEVNDGVDVQPRSE